MTAFAMSASAGMTSDGITGTLTTNPTAYGTYGVYGYNGEYTHTSLGLQYLRARYLNVATGTFTSRDTYAGKLQDILSQNRYTYAENNPIGHSDPSGHAPKKSGIGAMLQKTANTLTKMPMFTAPKARAATQAAVSAYAEEQKNRYTSVNRSVDNYTIREQRNNAWMQQLDEYAGSVLNGYHSILNATVYENSAVDNRWIKAIALSSEAVACASYTKCRNGIQELIKGKDAGRITHGSGLILEGTAKVFGSVFAATLSAGSAATGAGVPLAAFFATEATWLLSGSISDVNQGINELVLGWNGDSLTGTEHLFSETYYGGDFVTYQMHTNAMMIATDVYVLAKALPQVLTKKGDDLVETTLRQKGKDGSKADTLAQNRIQGRVYEQQEFANFSSQNNNAVEQITIRTESGVRTRVDAIGIDSNGNVVINEFKSSATAPLTNNQKIAFQEIMESGGVVVGEGKGIFTGGYQIPAGTQVQIIRPK